MIAQLRGLLASKDPGQIVVDVNGVGYQVFVPLSTFYQLPEVHQEVRLRVYTHVREDAIQLYGFHSAEERMTFELLTGVSGIGPRLAANILSGISVEEFIPAVLEGDIARLKAIPGVGRKTAERIIVELKDKVMGVPCARRVVVSRQPRPERDRVIEDVVSALLNLGCNRKEASAAAEAAHHAVGDGADFETFVKQALKYLSEGTGKRS
ncbi:Holliday junction DNA helicase ruvA [Candidatus Methylomirabilis lanthanidiphila]|uniref:Holliday junction branch migration complex subunit RuvA n=1 Tax=Candidatus Methylomirabilis lanthanidiphila TaxID=2211376 RepID=A0A564ZPG9_9BACT|nr:Holliday junction branch migration protein RuvA [Candidatus Methylomirabilis lanthanidiphila]VUZ86552.1 Holliday junction DNA helicase ruvA [Candidatus Methylomirabilis lanthanidiphila]